MNERWMIEWISNASYEELLYKWRNEPAGSPWFQGEVGDHFVLIKKQRNAEVPLEEQIQASKNIGW